jgi:hypothetical protein
LFIIQFANHFIYLFLLKGGLCSWWKRNFGICEEIDDTYGHLPYQSTWDENFRQKRLACHEDPDHSFKVFDSKMKVVNYTNFIRVLIEEVKVCCCLRSSKEPSLLVRDNWEFFTIQEGHFKGTLACRLNPDHAGQKNKAITMANHTVNDTLKNVQHLPILKTNKKFDTYTMIHRQLFDFLPSDEQIIGPARMFRKEASPKQQKVSLLYIYMLLFIMLLFMSLLHHYQLRPLTSTVPFSSSLYRFGRRNRDRIVNGEQIQTRTWLLGKTCLVLSV